MPWAKLDDGIYRNRKLLECKPASRWLYVAAIAYCREAETGGELTRGEMTMLVQGQSCTKGHVVELVHAGLLADIDYGYSIIAYAEFNPLTSTERVRRHREHTGEQPPGNAGETQVKRTGNAGETPGETHGVTVSSRAPADVRWAIPIPEAQVPLPTGVSTQAPLTPLARDPLLAAFLTAVSEGLGRNLSQADQRRLTGWWDEMPRLTPSVVKAQILDYLDWRQKNLGRDEAPLRGIGPLHDQLRSLDARMADEGRPIRGVRLLEVSS
jgi:hypothetical protein